MQKENYPMLLADSLLRQKGDMVFLRYYQIVDGYVISIPRFDHLPINGVIPLGALLESCGQLGEILCCKILGKVDKIMLTRIEDFMYRAITIEESQFLRYEACLHNQFGNFVKTLILVYFKEELIMKFYCTHYVE